MCVHLNVVRISGKKHFFSTRKSPVIQRFRVKGNLAGGADAELNGYQIDAISRARVTMFRNFFVLFLYLFAAPVISNISPRTLNESLSKGLLYLATRVQPQFEIGPLRDEVKETDEERVGSAPAIQHEKHETIDYHFPR